MLWEDFTFSVFRLYYKKFTNIHFYPLHVILLTLPVTNYVYFDFLELIIFRMYRLLVRCYVASKKPDLANLL